ncbi:hypothetical protein Tco_0216873, partial [Tanacetum coccineum]
QAQEQEELSIEEKATLFQQLLEKRRKHFAAKRAEEKRNKPPTKAQQKKIMCTYVKNMEGYKLNDLKLKDFYSIQEMFDRAFKRVNTFEDFRTELVEGKEKRAGTELIQENTKKQKVEDDKETAELKQLMKIIPDEEEVAIDAIPLAVKSPSIVDWKIYKEGRKSYYQIIRADGKSQMYMFFSQMLKNFDREDLEDLYKLVKAKFESTKPVEDLDLLLWGDLKTMFEPHVEDAVWRNQQAYKVLDWKLYDSCGVHSLRMQHMQIYMLVEKKYPLAPLTLSMMLEKKLNIDYESEMAYQLLKFIIKQLKNLLDAVRITAAHVCVNTAQLDLVLLMNFKENILIYALPSNSSGLQDEEARKNLYQRDLYQARSAVSITLHESFDSSPILADITKGIGNTFRQDYDLSPSDRRLKAAKDCKKCYADKRRKPLEFSIDDQVLLKVSPWKGVVRFGKRGKLARGYMGPFEIVERISPIAYQLRLPQKLSGIHDTFNVSNLKKCVADTDLHVPLDELKLDDNLRFVEEPLEILDCEVKCLKQGRIPILKVRWKSCRGPEFT